MLKKLRAWLMVGVASVGLAIGGSVFSATPAEAYPANCQATKTNATLFGTALVTCGSGTGQFRAVAGCKNVFGFWKTPVGIWVNVGEGSARVNCPWGYPIQWAGLNAR